MSRPLGGVVLFGALLIPLSLGTIPGIIAQAMNPRPSSIQRPPSDLAVSIHQSLEVADLHSDVLLWGRSLGTAAEYGHVDLDRLRQGRITLQVLAAVTSLPVSLGGAELGPDAIGLLAVVQGWPLDTWASPLSRALFQADRLRRLVAHAEGRVRIVRTAEDLEAVDPAGPLGTVLGLEGGYALEGDPGNLDVLFAAGFRVFGPVHLVDSALGGSTHEGPERGLTPFGRTVVGRMNDLGMAVDLAHASPALIRDVLALVEVPVLVSHTGVRATCDRVRNLADEEILAIGRSGGVIGIGLWPEALCGRTPDDWVRAVSHVVGLVGVDHVALGSDWDGAVEVVVDPSGTIHLTNALTAAGYSPDEIRRIMGDNVRRVLSETLPRLSTGVGRSSLRGK